MVNIYCNKQVSLLPFLVGILPKVSSAAQQLTEATIGFKLAPREKLYAESKRSMGYGSKNECKPLSLGGLNGSQWSVYR